MEDNRVVVGRIWAMLRIYVYGNRMAPFLTREFKHLWRDFKSSQRKACCIDWILWPATNARQHGTWNSARLPRFRPWETTKQPAQQPSPHDAFAKALHQPHAITPRNWKVAHHESPLQSGAPDIWGEDLHNAQSPPCMHRSFWRQVARHASHWRQHQNQRHRLGLEYSAPKEK